MKFFLLILLSLSLNAYTQTSYTQSAPISISADGLAGEAGEDEETMRARSELAASKVKATDGEKEAEKETIPEQANEKTIEETKLVQENPPVLPQPKPIVKRPQIDWSFDWKKRQRTLFFKFGLLNSSWNKISPELEKGSTVLGLGLNQSLSDSFSFGVSLDFHHFRKGSLVPEEIRILGLRFEPQFLHRLNANFSLIGSFALTLGDSNIRKKIQASSSMETYRVFSSGTVFAFSPGFGFRGHFSQDVYFDLVSEYQYFVGKPEKYYGGLGGSIRLHMSL